MDLKKKSVSVTSGKQWQAFKLALCLQCFICKKKLVINNKVMLNNSRIHFQVSSIFSKEYHQILQMIAFVLSIELLVYLFYLFLNSNLFIFVTGTKVVVARTALYYVWELCKKYVMVIHRLVIMTTISVVTKNLYG